VFRKKKNSRAGKAIRLVEFFEKIASGIDLKRLRKTGILAVRREGIFDQKVGRGRSSCKPIEPLKGFR
jgi:hypothetical protein